VATDVQLEGFRRFYCADPFGNRLEFLERIDPARRRARRLSLSDGTRAIRRDRWTRRVAATRPIDTMWGRLPRAAPLSYCHSRS